MNAIIKYIINMLPYRLIAIPIYLIVRGIWIKTKKVKINWYHEIALFIFVLFIVGLASQTIIPKIELSKNGFKIVKNGFHETNLIPFKVFKETYIEVFANGNINYLIINFLGNIIMFMPLGFFIPLLWNISNKKVVIIGFCTSLFIELCQLFLIRGTDIDDLILNTIGVVLGLLLYKMFSTFLIKFRKNSMEEITQMILVSACLVGINCKYDGGNNFNEKIFNLVKEGKAIPICPEQLGGLATPRSSSEIQLKDNNIYVMDKSNNDVTEKFKIGAIEVLNLAKKLNIKKAILQPRSPSCGTGKIYNGNFEGKLIDGNGILAQLLIDNGIEVINSEEY